MGVGQAYAHPTPIFSGFSHIFMELRRFTKEELGQYNGKNGAPPFIAYKGMVYDLSRSLLWHDGKHQVIHAAGSDLTGELDQAPHGADLLARFPIVGTLSRAA
jgi:predicted heme/steroid binding protein